MKREIGKEEIQAKIVDLNKLIKRRRSSNEEIRRIKNSFYHPANHDDPKTASKIILCGDEGVVKVFSISNKENTISLDQEFSLQLTTMRMKDLNLFPTRRLEWQSDYCQKTQKLKNIAPLSKELKSPLSVYQEVDINNPSKRRLIPLRISTFGIERQNYKELILQHRVSLRSWLRKSLFAFLKKRPRIELWGRREALN